MPTSKGVFIGGFSSEQLSEEIVKNCYRHLILSNHQSTVCSFIEILDEKVSELDKNSRQGKFSEDEHYVRMRLVMSLRVYVKTLRFIFALLHNDIYAESLFTNIRTAYEVYLRWLFLLQIPLKGQYLYLMTSTLLLLKQMDMPEDYKKCCNKISDDLPISLSCNIEEDSKKRIQRDNEFGNFPSYNAIIGDNIKNLDLRGGVKAYRGFAKEGFATKKRVRIYSFISESAHGNEMLSGMHGRESFYITVLAQESSLCLLELLGTSYPELTITSTQIQSLLKENKKTSDPLIKIWHRSS